MEKIMAGNSNEDENERTSLLASSSAPPTVAAPYPSGSARGSGRSNVIHVSGRPSLTGAELEELERSAQRLVGRENDDGNVLPDSDSVNGLLAGCSDDDASAGSIGGLGEGDEADKNTPVTMNDLEFLTGSRGGGNNSSFDVEGQTQEEKDEETREQSAHDVDDREKAMLSQRVHESTRALRASVGDGIRKNLSYGGGAARGGGELLKKPQPTSQHAEIEPSLEETRPTSLRFKLLSLIGLTLFIMLLLFAVLALGTLAVGPPLQPSGEYRILEAQVGNDFWKYYNFYAGKDSAGSNGYINYVSREDADNLGIARVVTEEVPKERMIQVYEEGDPRVDEELFAEELAFLDQLNRKKADEEQDKEDSEVEVQESSEDKVTGGSSNNSTGSEKKKGSDHRQLLPGTALIDDHPAPKLEPFNPNPATPDTANNSPAETFVIMSSSPTESGPRNSLRLEGRRRFNRGLFIIDLRHMPAGCGTWPAFWLTDEANWPVNGEIDIVEGVNYQDTAKTALHSTKECMMDDVPEGSKTGSWDTSVGIPNKKTGIPDMTFRYAQNCFVYDPHQWLNQGCVATDLKSEGRSLGMPLNANGGGVYALEWDPVNHHVRTWVFSPHGRVPSNLREAMRTATEEEEGKRVAPDTNQWGLPYGHFPIGEGTKCPSGHFRNMRLVINLAFCGSVSGNRYFMDCPEQFKKYKTCNEYVASDPEELKEAYWKIRGVYIYERAWERQWA